MQIQNMPSFNPQGLPQGSQATALTDDQKAKSKEILAQYDMENFSAEDRLSLRKELHAQGIKGKQAQHILKELPKTEESPTEPGSSAEIKEANNPKAVLMQLLEQQKSGEIEDKDFSSQLAEMKIESIGALLNTQA